MVAADVVKTFSAVDLESLNSQTFMILRTISRLMFVREKRTIALNGQGLTFVFLSRISLLWYSTVLNADNNGYQSVLLKFGPARFFFVRLKSFRFVHTSTIRYVWSKNFFVRLNLWGGQKKAQKRPVKNASFLKSFVLHRSREAKKRPTPFLKIKRFPLLSHKRNLNWSDLRGKKRTDIQMWTRMSQMSMIHGLRLFFARTFQKAHAQTIDNAEIKKKVFFCRPPHKQRRTLEIFKWA